MSEYININKRYYSPEESLALYRNVGREKFQKKYADNSFLMNTLNKMSKKILAHMTETAALLLAAILYPLGVVTFNPKKLPPEAKKVTILVHGFLHNSSAWAYIKYKLKKEPSLGPIFTLNLGHPFQSIESYTQKLSKEIEKIRSMTADGALEVNLVGHSMGGLVCSNYAANLSSSSPIYINKIVTIASPIKGSPLAKLISFLPCGSEMETSSGFLKDLQIKVNRMKSEIFFHIGCEYDLIVPNQFTAFDHINNRFKAKSLGHLSCLFSPTVTKSIVQALKSV